jgi:hypothetical protein
MPTIERALKDETDRRLRIKLWFPLPPAVVRRAAAVARALKRIAGTTIQVDEPSGEPFESHPGCSDNKIRRKTAAEAHRVGVWFAVYFNLDCRKADLLSQTAARLRKHIAELSEIADRIDAAAKRRPKIARVSRKAGDAASA